MKKNPFARRLAFAVLPIGLVVLASGCAVDTQEPPVGEEAVGQTSQALSTWAAYGWGTTNDLDGHDTGLYSWDLLYDLGRDKEEKLRVYRETLRLRGLRDEA